MNASFSNRWIRKSVVLSILLSGLIAAPSKAADNDRTTSGPSACELLGGSYQDLGGVDRCCVSSFCMSCSRTTGQCIKECFSRTCCMYMRTAASSLIMGTG
jgi:hypothetical protein